MVYSTSDVCTFFHTPQGFLHCQTFYLSTRGPLTDLYQRTEKPHALAKYNLTANYYYYKIQQQK